MLVPSIISKECKKRRKSNSFTSLKLHRSSDFFEALSCQDYEPVYSGRVIKIKVVEVTCEIISDKESI